MSDPIMENTAPPAAPVSARKSFNRFFSLRTPVGRFLWFGLLLMALFAKPLANLVLHAATSNLHSYILLVPVISLYLIYDRRDRLPRSYSSSPVLASFPFLVGLAALVSTMIFSTLSYNDHLTLVALSFVCLLTAGAFSFLGQEWMRAAAFPVFFLIFLIPMPDAMADSLETGSKLASTEAANLFFNLTGTPVLRDGTIFQLPNILIQVGQECSGIRSSVVLVLTSLVAANLFLKSTWRRALLIGFVIPLGIIRNGFRVWVIGTLCIYFGPQMIHGIVHRRGGPLFFTLALIPFFAVLWWLRRGDPAPEVRRQKSDHGGRRAES